MEKGAWDYQSKTTVCTANRHSYNTQWHREKNRQRHHQRDIRQKEMKHIPLFIIGLILLCAVGCGSKDATKNNAKDLNRSSAFMTDSFKHFENDLFSFDYPSNMFIEEEVNNMSDSIEGLKTGVDVSVYRMDIPVSFRFVKSAMVDAFTSPEEWRDLSIQLKETTDNNYIGYIETQDSLWFCGSPAASVTLAFNGEQGDTLVQYQLVVLRENNDLFYLNCIAPNYLYDETQALADTVFHTFKFK